jgi:GxxExxY protein
MPLDPNIPHQDITYRIIGAAMRVHNRLGPGLKEQYYQRALTIEMREARLKVSEEHHIEIYDGDRWLGRLYLDHLVEECVEVEAFSHMLTDEEVAQVICYLAATELKVGILLKFGRKRLEYRRILAPKKLDAWRERIRRYLWEPKELSADKRIADWVSVYNFEVT